MSSYIDELRRPSDAKGEPSSQGQSTTAEIAQIQERQANRHKCIQLGDFDAVSVVVSTNDVDKVLHALAESQRDNARLQADIDTLLEDCARHRNAHVINMARAEAAERRVRELEGVLHKIKFTGDAQTKGLAISALVSPLPTALAQPQAEQLPTTGGRVRV